jgi:hypothetical protein
MDNIDGEMLPGIRRSRVGGNIGEPLASSDLRI